MQVSQSGRVDHSPAGSPVGTGRLSLLDLTLIGCGATFGSGWLFASSRVATLAGPWGLLAWGIGGLVALLLGIIYCELGAALPQRGGVVRYPYCSHGRFLGFMVSLVTVVAFSSIVSIEVVAARQYVSVWFPALSQAGGAPGLAGWVVQALVIAFLCYLNLKDGKTFAWINNIVTILKFSVPFLVVGTLLPRLSAAPFMVPVSGSPVTGMVTALSSGGIIFAFLGLTPIVAAAGEVRHPQRNVPRALFASVAFTTVVYVVLQATFIGALPLAALHDGWGPIEDRFPLPFHDIMVVAGIAWVAVLVLSDACVSPLGTGNVYLSSTCRVADAWLHEAGLLPGNARRAGPVSLRAMVLSVGLCLFWTLPFPSWSSLVGVVSTAIVMSYAFVPVILAALRRSCPDLPRPFRVRWLGVIGPLSFVMSSFVVLWAGWHTVLWLLSGQIVLGMLYLACRVIASPRRAGALVLPNLWVLAYFCGMILFSCMDQDLAMETLAAPGRLVMFLVFLVGVYFWGAHSGLRAPTLSAASREGVLSASFVSMNISSGVR
ncbi:APC family permease [Komagataeibacter sp. FNDCF1]|uniref:APC family permease n=1 Tax=Komagataeibacter sp. FNDCF1 TaxID=2878681 RepID=UPI001E4B85F3|nr:APC family permease [Komagataeibacter sp. FNDCF1]MCE2563315.1 APC family permease [Komagataeibacter sp. FNDCF1]